MQKFGMKVAALCLALGASPALAQSSGGSAYAVGVGQTVTAPLAATINLSVGPLASSSASSPGSFDQSAAVASAGQNIRLVPSTPIIGAPIIRQRGTTGLLTSNVAGTADGTLATATVDRLSFVLGAFPDANLLNLLSLSATTIRSTSQAGSVGGLAASGSTTIEGLNLGGVALGSLVFDGNLFVNPAPNTVLIDLAGLRIVLNEQIRSGDGTTGTGITTNAIHVGFTNFALGTGLTNGNIIFGQSQAFATPVEASAPVPEPATWAMMLLGFGAIGFVMRRKTRTVMARAMA